MAKAAAKTPRKSRKRTAHIDDPTKPGTSINVETVMLIAKGDTIREFCEEKGEAKRRVGKINDGFNKSATAKVTKEHLHRSAANDAYALQAMEDKELHAYLYHFLFYVKDLRLLERCKKQEELFAADEVGPSPSANGAHQDDDSGKEEGQTDIEDQIQEADGTAATQRAGAAGRQVAEAAGETVKH